MKNEQKFIWFDPPGFIMFRSLITIFRLKTIIIKMFEMRKVSISILVIVSLIYLPGCVGTRFNYKNRTHLELGITSSEEAIKLLGEPERSETVSNKDGNYKILGYVYGYVTPIGGILYMMRLEFKDDKLNAYEGSDVSNITGGKTVFNFLKSENIKVGVSTEEDVKQFFGLPSGKAICPSTLQAYSKKCENATEIWQWYYLKKSQGSGPSIISTIFTNISFDKNGIVTDIKEEVL